SGITALLIAVTPLMITVFRLLSGDRPHRLSVFGVLLGFGGLAFLVLAGHGKDAGEIPLLAAVFLGALILSEPVTGAVVVGGGIVVLAVAIVISAERPRRKPVPEPEAECAGPGH
ncbi:MAG TPA: hypothetical protein VFJ09_14255, partial [Nocardioidaceae bacterium]|nr:hypothetical protein [Nocardioidaceae bacterium]